MLLTYMYMYLVHMHFAPFIGMHSLCVSSDGQVYSWGCNDEYALGRQPGEDEGCLPGLVTFPEPVKVVQVSAGDSHSVALTSDGRVFIWGIFRAQV